MWIGVFESLKSSKWYSWKFEKATTWIGGKILKGAKSFARIVETIIELRNWRCKGTLRLNFCSWNSEIEANRWT